MQYIMLTCPCNVHPLTPHFYIYSKTAVYRDIYYFLIFALKHTLLVLVKTASLSTNNLCFDQKYENSQKNSTENCYFYSRENSLYVAWVCFRNVNKKTIISAFSVINVAKANSLISCPFTAHLIYAFAFRICKTHVYS